MRRPELSEASKIRLAQHIDRSLRGWRVWYWPRKGFTAFARFDGPVIDDRCPVRLLDLMCCAQLESATAEVARAGP